MIRLSDRRFLHGLIAFSLFVWVALAFVVVPSARAVSLTGTITGSRYLDGIAVIANTGVGDTGWEVVQFVNFTPDITLASQDLTQFFTQNIQLELAPNVKNTILFNMRSVPSTTPFGPIKFSKDISMMGSFNIDVDFSFEAGGTLATTFDTETPNSSQEADRWFSLRHGINSVLPPEWDSLTNELSPLTDATALGTYDALTNPATLFRGSTSSENANTSGGWMGTETTTGILSGISSFADLLGYAGSANIISTHSITFGVTIIPNPEPATLALMAVGLGLVGFVARRRKREEDLLRAA